MALKRINQNEAVTQKNISIETYNKIISTPVPEFDKGFGYQGAHLFAYKEGGVSAQWFPYYHMSGIGGGFGPAYTNLPIQERSNLVEVGVIDRNDCKSFISFEDYKKIIQQAKTSSIAYFQGLGNELEHCILEREYHLYRERPWYDQTLHSGHLRIGLAGERKNYLDGTEIHDFLYDYSKCKIIFDIKESQNHPGYNFISDVHFISDHSDEAVDFNFTMQQRRNMFDFIQEKVLDDVNVHNGIGCNGHFPKVIPVSKKKIDELFPGTEQMVGTLKSKIKGLVILYKEKKAKKNQFHL